ncbi:amidohydrolase family protein [Advenella sp. FME57]|uniref:amidohydrolase family protein n=1 Tax=Advenella sp. FME57 TaxID=2742604 RepID=UPI001D02287D|nr:amidohydrolase family protein [Advenella sp. FME57]
MYSRRKFIQGLAALTTLGAGSSMIGYAAESSDSEELFDSHCHIIDPNYPLIPNQGYLPPPYPLQQYLSDVKPLRITSGAVVSGSFQGFDQTYLKAVLSKLGPRWVGVTQAPANMPDSEISDLAAVGVRALRFNMYRGRTTNIDDLVQMATRVHTVGKWHAEIYADAASLKQHVEKLSKLPQIVIDHLGMTEEGLPVLLDLVDAGARIKATGFGRVKMNVPKVLERIAQRNPDALIFGTDLPSTRAKRPFQAQDIQTIREVLGPQLSRKVLWDNAVSLYRPTV